MDTQVAIGSLVAFLGLGYLAYRYSDDGVSESTVLSREDVVRILKELQAELKNVFMQISAMVMSIKEQMGGRIPEEYIKEIIMSQTPVAEQISSIESKVYQKNSTTQADFEKACDVTYAGDIEIERIKKETKKTLDDSYSGITPSFNLPSWLTADKTSKIFMEMNYATLIGMYDLAAEMRSKGISDPNSPQFQMELQRQGPKMEKEVYKVFEKYSLTGLSEPASIIIQFAINKFGQEDPRFKNLTIMCQQQMEQKISEIMTGRVDPREIEAMRAHLNSQPLFQELEEMQSIEQVDAKEEGEEEGSGSDLAEAEEVAEVDEGEEEMLKQLS